ncbi:acyl-CoA dehydrogenase family protein [Geodermatophilus nigrescens]|uniref:Acyl-CoA dehydrogenase n=1 Tax=Geodermatophilus nigrescens TaxID=1070870 RepID=A0A1M5HY59_9ACTN|nr:acyl-CoA dehydrogenase family protein [Geodermatophilus nigrescens]SHG20898.1 Acyl-CoA dehydrogenase [Geodermatophilus nigrescens]
MPAPVEAARALAAGVLAPAAAGVDATGVLPRTHLDALAAAGLYGVVGPASAGGLDGDGATLAAVVEELAAGDLATAFVYLQHHGVVGRLAASGAHPGLLADLCAGRVRAGIALQAATRPDAGPVTLRRDGGELVLDGTVPWVTGWGLVDVLVVAARDGEDVAFVLADAVGGPTLEAVPQPLVAVQASATVELRLRGHRVPVGRLLGTTPLAQVRAGDAAGLRVNGSLALGLVRRCAALVGPSPLDAALVAARARLDAAGPEDLSAARAEAAALAHRAAGALVVASGSAAARAGSVAERTAREAVFLLVFGSRPAIRAHLLDRFGAGG